MSERPPVWIVCAYGGLPDEGNRDYRFSLLGRVLARRGHRVIWWTSTFNHWTKQQRSGTSSPTGVPGFEIRLVNAPIYRSNVSFGRIRFEAEFGRNLKAAVADEPSPGTIILAEPARFYGDVVADLAAKYDARLVLDIMDLWPELFEMLLPRAARLFGRLALSSLYRQRRNLVRRADAAVGVTQDYLDAVISDARVSIPQHVAWLGSHGRVADEGEVPQEVRSAVRRNPRIETLAIYAGTLGNNYDIDTLVEAARRSRSGNICWLVAGAGPFSGIVEKAAKELDGHFKYVGFQPAAVVNWALRQCDVGLCCYREGSTVSLPLKAFDYWAAGLPVVTSLEREIGRLIDSEGIGCRYESGNPDSLIRAVLKFSDPSIRKQCSDSALEFGQKVSGDASYDGYVDFLEREKLLRTE